MRKTILILLVALSTLAAKGQTALSAAQQKQTIEQIDRAAQAVKTMQCSFTQVRTTAMMKKPMTAEGKMQFSKPSKLRWQYTKPYEYTFTMDGDKAYMTKGKSTKTVSGRKSKVFKRVADVIVGCIMGGNMSKKGYFDIAMYRQGSDVYASLSPLSKEMKSVYKTIVLHFNRALTTVNKVEMIEKNGDKTVITLSNIKINQ